MRDMKATLTSNLLWRRLSTSSTFAMTALIHNFHAYGVAILRQARLILFRLAQQIRRTLSDQWLDSGRERPPIRTKKSIEPVNGRESEYVALIPYLAASAQALTGQATPCLFPLCHSPNKGGPATVTLCVRNSGFGRLPSRRAGGDRQACTGAANCLVLDLPTGGGKSPLTINCPALLRPGCANHRVSAR